MQALILAGGRGTRLRPLTVYTPKPVVSVVNRPFLIYQIEILAKAGVKDIKLSLSYLPDKIEDVLGDGSELGVKLTYITEPAPLGTAGAFGYAADHIAETTLVLNGDVLTDIDIGDLISFHSANKSQATLVLTPVADPTAYGLVESAADGAIRRFLEKPKLEDLEHISTRNINAGIYVLEPTILDLVPKGESSSFEYNVFPAILEKELPFYAYVLDRKYWRDIGTPSSYLSAHHDFLDGKINKLVADVGESDSDIATAAVVDRISVLGAGCVVKPGARISRSVIGPGVHVDEKAVIENSVIWSHTRVSAAAEVHDAVIARGCHIGRSVEVRAGAVLGDKTMLPDYSRT
ncbi:MAG: sugar phosphate nucleotidyltransferase [Pyrinomonadaceae bacterium]